MIHNRMPTPKSQPMDIQYFVPDSTVFLKRDKIRITE